MLVIILAMIAIITAVVIMSWPTSPRAEDKHGSLEPAVPDKPVSRSAQDDPWSPSTASSGPTGSAPVGNDAVLAQLTKHICDRVSQCGNLGSLNGVCAFIDHASDPLPASCSAARRCFEHIDAMTCGAQLDDPDALKNLLMKLPDCIDAINC
jgi:hypothetical protein